MSYRTPLGRITGLGSARDGTGHFWKQRLTAAANIPLILVFIWLIVTHNGADRARLIEIFSNPLISAATILMVVSAGVHMKLGLQVVIEDYIHSEALKLVLILLNIFFAFGVVAVALVSLLVLSSGG